MKRYDFGSHLKEESDVEMLAGCFTTEDVTSEMQCCPNLLSVSNQSVSVKTEQLMSSCSIVKNPSPTCGYCRCVITVALMFVLASNMKIL